MTLSFSDVAYNSLNPESFLRLAIDHGKLSPDVLTKDLFDRVKLHEDYTPSPRYYIPTESKIPCYLYKISQWNIVEYEWIAEASGVRYTRIPAREYYKVSQYVGIRLPKLYADILANFPDITTYWDGHPLFLDIIDGETKHTIYLNPAIFFDPEEQTIENALAFFRKYNHWTTTEKAIAFLATPAWLDAFNAFVARIHSSF